MASPISTAGIKRLQNRIVGEAGDLARKLRKNLPAGSKFNCAAGVRVKGAYGIDREGEVGFIVEGELPEGAPNAEAALEGPDYRWGNRGEGDVEAYFEFTFSGETS